MSKTIKVGDRVSTESLNKNFKDIVLTGVVDMIHSNGWYTVQIGCPYTRSSVSRRLDELTLIEPVEPTDEELAATYRAGRAAAKILADRGFIFSVTGVTITVSGKPVDIKKPPAMGVVSPEIVL